MFTESFKKVNDYILIGVWVSPRPCSLRLLPFCGGPQCDR